MKAKTKQAARMKPWKGWCAHYGGTEWFTPRTVYDSQERARADYKDSPLVVIIRVEVREVRPSAGKRRAQS